MDGAGCRPKCPRAHPEGQVTTLFHPRPDILHISGDFPDPINPSKTPVIRTLLEMTDDTFAHRVISLNRKSPGPVALSATLLGRSPLSRIVPFERGMAAEYLAPPMGLLHKTLLHRVADALVERLAEGPRPALIVGHKLSIEGIVARRMARRLDIPFAISIQGNTDTRIVDARPDLRGELRRVFHEASVAFPFAPWALRRIEARLGRRRGLTTMLPCPTDIDEPVAPAMDGNQLVSVFHLRNHGLKNLRGLALAMRELASTDPDIRLSIIGGGSDEDVGTCRAILGDLPNVELAGAMDRRQLREALGGSAGFVLPSLRESFGLVFIEALFCGLPVVYPTGRAVDGYFDGEPFAIGVDPRQPGRIAEGMRTLVREQAPLKRALARWQQDGRARQFTRPEIAASFAAGLTAAVEAGTRP